MKKLLVLIKALVLISGLCIALLRFISFKYEAAFSPEELNLMLKGSIVSAAVLVLCGILWMLIEKKQAKSSTAQTLKTAEETAQDETAK